MTCSWRDCDRLRCYPDSSESDPKRGAGQAEFSLGIVIEVLEITGCRQNCQNAILAPSLSMSVMRVDKKGRNQVTSRVESCAQIWSSRPVTVCI
ncbi:hypothetical protein K443DRAFT_439942 [Laccaria amethystina LaAM-08-1]|uniref:Unplaced genomic scaffold K443scaffold_386, whole genome shotgun sequence n=1 Tax=Laccaria amethystina LaAM-08-1 TaxID=1095629 RepID=A0A0C9WNU7_9AGAR|nr:hypothetical protein K443DRAFT_439942 [Laccaria amethystina LaAM-08-1]